MFSTLFPERRLEFVCFLADPAVPPGPGRLDSPSQSVYSRASLGPFLGVREHNTGEAS